MIKYATLVFLIVTLSFSCSTKEEVKKDSKPSKSELKAEIKEMDDSLKVLYKNVMEIPGFKFPYLAITEAINRNLAFYRNYPDDQYAASCLDKVQQLYLQNKTYELSLSYTDTLLLKYPKYSQRSTLLLNAGSTGEILQDTAIIRKYYTQLLKEFPNTNPETKKMLNFRLKNLHLTFDQLIDLQIQEAKKGK